MSKLAQIKDIVAFWAIRGLKIGLTVLLAPIISVSIILFGIVGAYQVQAVFWDNIITYIWHDMIVLS